MNIKPLNSWILTKKKESENEGIHKSGIILKVDNRRSDTVNVVIVNMGGIESEDLKEGIEVMIDVNSCEHIKIEDIEHYLVKEDNILAVVE